MIYKFIVIYIKINYMVHKNKKTIISNTLCLSLGILLPISTQILTISCTAIKSSNDNVEQEIILKENDIVEKINENSKLNIYEKEEEKKKQKDFYKDLSIEKIDNYLINNTNINLWNYFIKLNEQNNLTKGDPNYIDPNLGILLVEDVINGDILVKDIDNQMEDFKNENHDEYIQALDELNLSEEQVEEAKDIEEVIAIDPEEEQINKDFEDMENGTYVETDEMFQLNDIYNDGDIIEIDYILEDGFFDYQNYDKFETRYVDEHYVYFEEPLVVTIEMSDETKIEINDFDITELEYDYHKSGIFNCISSTRLFYGGELVYECWRDWWKDGYRSFKKMYFEFKKITNIVGEKENIISTENEQSFTISLNKEKYDFIWGLEDKLISMQTYYKNSHNLNDTTFMLSSVATGVAAAWGVSAIFSLGGTSGLAVAAGLQATSLWTTYLITRSELSKTNSKLNKYWKFYNSSEYEFLIGFLNDYSHGNKLDFASNEKKEITVEIYELGYKIWDFNNEIIKKTGIIISKNANKFLNEPTLITISYRELKSMKETFESILVRRFEKITSKLGKKFFSKITSVGIKEAAERLVCIATSWANPVMLAIDLFDIVITTISICNDVFYS